ncbi:MAG: zinc-binding dehydrogenase [Bacteroidia bacterium]|nr:zinc-binding dehydrogenase [Bacteroidia bacterium]MDW8348178.1 zinc-binding dehydrogenase [Bacteroidia bacterium]
MKAAILKGVHQPIMIEEVPTPEIKEDEVLIEIKSAALNHRDLWIQKGQYAGLKFPIILGSDGAGVIHQVDRQVKNITIGQSVVINPSWYWGSNPKVQSKEYRILGLPDNGTFAQYIKVPAIFVYPKPEHLSFSEAAAYPLAGLTAYRATITRAEVQAGEKVLITGIGGGVAFFAMQFALVRGAEVYVTSSSSEKIEKVMSYGVKAGFNYKSPSWEKEALGYTGGFDAIIDGAAGETFTKLIEVCRPGGRIVFYGGTAGIINNVLPAKVFWKQLTIMGSTMGNDTEFESMLEMIKQYKLIPMISHQFTFDNIQAAFEVMDKGEQFGKIVVNF